MATDRRSAWIDASAEAVWARVGDAGAVSTWFPSIASSSLSGTRRVCVLSSGATIAEEIVTHDNRLRRLQYRIVAGIETSFHLGTVDVIADGEGRCLVVYSTEVTPDELAPALGASVQQALARLSDLMRSV